MMASRRTARTTGPSAKRPSASGPRCRSSSTASSADAGGGSPPEAMPKMPHTLPIICGAMAQPDYSFVIPVYNESETLPELERRLVAVFGKLDGPAEAILVDDGSSDRR